MPRLNLSSEELMKMGKLITDAWRFPKKRKAFLVNPQKAMAEAGIDIPNVDGMRIVVLENTYTTFHLVLPMRPRVLGVDQMVTEDFYLDLGRRLFGACH